MPLVYDERRDHTQQATALVHEAYLRLVGPRDIHWQNRSHFFAGAAQAMRRILVDHARAKAAAIRGAPPSTSAPSPTSTPSANPPDS